MYNAEPRPHDYVNGPQPGFLGAQTGQTQHFEGATRSRRAMRTGRRAKKREDV